MIRYLIIAVLTATAVSGCVSHPENDTAKNSDGANMYQRGTFSPVSNQEPSLGVQDYAKELVAKMAMNMRSVNAKGTVAVTHFVATGEDYQSTNHIGFTLAEAFMSELHQFGLTTLDYKVSDFIRVTPQGDFVMTRDYLELKDAVAADYVLVGTYSPHRQGLLVHARIVNLQTKAVLASGETIIPAKQVNMLPGAVTNPLHLRKIR